MKPTRTQRLNSEYQREISSVISGALKNKEPDLKGIISVTEADVAPDLKTAKIYVSVLASSPAEKKRTFELILRNAGFIRHELAKVMQMRTVPYLTFLEDGSMEYGSKMDALFEEIKKEELKKGETE